MLIIITYLVSDIIYNQLFYFIFIYLVSISTIIYNFYFFLNDIFDSMNYFIYFLISIVIFSYLFSIF